MDSEDEYLPEDSDFDAEDLGRLEEDKGEHLAEETKPRGAGTARKRRSRSRQRAVPPPFKRARGAFNAQYLHLLNEDIQDAATGIVLDSGGGGVPLEPTQIGAVMWSAAEKTAFFSALGRLGRDDLAGIAARIRTKSEPEVRQYLLLLDASNRHRRSDEDKRHRVLRAVDIPAAAEVSQACCAALEQAADGLALRQERHEEALERKRWRGRWLITPARAQVLESQYHQQQRDGGLPAFAELFALRTWLRLSERVFMNSAVPDGNWRCVVDEAEDDAPSVRATAFADFHALALSVTRRLVLASLYIAESRVRAKNTGDPRHRTRPLVRPHDVRVAAASVGLKEDARVFWARCARRLRLDVHDDDDNDDDDSPLREGVKSEKHDDAIISTDEEDGDSDENPEDEDEEEDEDRGSIGGGEKMDTDTDQDNEYDIMTYDAVEAALGLPQPDAPSDTTAVPLGDDNDELSDSLSAIFDVEDEATEEADPDPRLDPTAIERDLDEAITYSALPSYPGTTRAKQALRARIRREHLLEAEAEQFDARAGAREEAYLWNLLRGEEAEDDDLKGGEVKADAAMTPTSAAAGTGDETGEEYYTEGDAEEFGTPGRKSQARRSAPLVDLDPDWRDGLTYYSEWEGLRKRGAG
ncbi:hypothetical protein F4810DRAFT_447840 [Camillea tinctor]|nr:hypothetical protein F4810DRAFT_447840 [Camillea tinctor]